MENSAIADVTAILTVWKRSHLIEQLEALRKQSTLLKHIVVVQCENHTYFDLGEFPDVGLIHLSTDLGIYARFTVPLVIRTKFCWIIDDDIIPANSYLENVIRCYRQHGSIVAGGGTIIDAVNFDKRVKIIGYRGVNQDTEVDIACNSYFFETRWIHSFWRYRPFSLDNGEDIHLSAALSLEGIKTFVPAQVEAHQVANLKPRYGKSEDALYKKAHHNHQRSQLCRRWFYERHWKPLFAKNWEN